MNNTINDQIHHDFADKIHRNMPSTRHTMYLCKIRSKGDIKNVRQKGKLSFIIKRF